MELLIIRHARPVRHVALDGDSADPGLSEIGRIQAETTASFLAQEPIDHIVASTMLRAMQTAEPLAERLGIEIEALDELRESNHRSQVYVPAEEISRDDPDTLHYFDADLSDDDLSEIVFSEGYDGFRSRVSRGFQHVIDTNRSRTVAVFCHGMVKSVFLQTLLGHSDVFKLLIDYCGISRVAAASTGLRTVRSVNETQHVRTLLAP